jgi:hypothetical protein
MQKGLRVKMLLTSRDFSFLLSLSLASCGLRPRPRLHPPKLTQRRV